MPGLLQCIESKFVTLKLSCSSFEVIFANFMFSSTSEMAETWSRHIQLVATGRVRDATLGYITCEPLVRARRPKIS